SRTRPPAGPCARRPATLTARSGFRCRLAAEVPDVLAGSRRLSRADRLAQLAAREALDDAGVGPADRRTAAVLVGAVGGGMLEAEAWYWRRVGRGEAGPPTPGVA